jgi:hypothetical protein
MHVTNRWKQAEPVIRSPSNSDSIHGGMELRVD